MTKGKEIQKTSIIDRALLADKELFYNDMILYDVGNKVWISGTLESDFSYSHSFIGRKYYKARVMVKRLSGVIDYVPIVVLESLLETFKADALSGRYVEITGRYASHQYFGDDGRRHFEYFVSAKELNVCEKNPEEEDVNLVYLDGYVCHEPVYRVTPFGRVLTDVTIAIHRENSKGKDYCWCIAWENFAFYAKNLKLGDKITVCGRIQSREYFKRISENSDEGCFKTTYEISIADIKM